MAKTPHWPPYHSSQAPWYEAVRDAECGDFRRLCARLRDPSVEIGPMERIAAAAALEGRYKRGKGNAPNWRTQSKNEYEIVSFVLFAEAKPEIGARARAVELAAEKFEKSETAIRDAVRRMESEAPSLFASIQSYARLSNFDE